MERRPVTAAPRPRSLQVEKVLMKHFCQVIFRSVAKGSRDAKRKKREAIRRELLGLGLDVGDDHGNVVLLVLSDRNHCHGHRDRVGIVGRQLLLLGRVEALRRESPILRCHLHAVLLLLLLLLLHRLVVEPAAHCCHHLHAAFLLRIEGLLMLLMLWILRAHVIGPSNHLGGMACWRGVDALARSRSRTCNCNWGVASDAEPPDTAADRTTTT